MRCVLDGCLEACFYFAGGAADALLPTGVITCFRLALYCTGRVS